MKTEPTNPTKPTDAPALRLPEIPWLIWSHEHQAWWRGNFSGYTRHIEAAGRYSRIDAERICCEATRGQRKFADDPPPEVAVIAPEYAESCNLIPELVATLEEADRRLVRLDADGTGPCPTRKRIRAALARTGMGA